ncbi:dehydrodolichyl diphosphate synthase complex subunit NUS1 [Culicoides brevitarsis]|uniref:dehydrodolichyl diphosphate synthase complex subunit NUS1 n=1 Tax=Culicoides brevitarsis TaxID=469753 RepID=UPI00307B94F9
MRIFFIFLHKLLLLALAVYWLGEFVLTKLREFLSSGNPDDLERDRRYIEHKIRNLERSPVHLAIILGNEAPQYGVLGKLIIWAAAAGIKHISLYDHEGVLKRDNDKVRKHVKALKSDHEQILWGPDFNNGAVDAVPPMNGYKTRLFVNFFAPDDGKRRIIETSQDLAADVKHGKLSIDEITIDFVDKSLKKHIYGLPDPDLALYFGGVCSNFGFLPWHTRLTEFLSIKSQANVTSPDFVRSLFRFSKCEQRFGK